MSSAKTGRGEALLRICTVHSNAKLQFDDGGKLTIHTSTMWSSVCSSYCPTLSNPTEELPLRTAPSFEQEPLLPGPTYSGPFSLDVNL